MNGEGEVTLAGFRGVYNHKYKSNTIGIFHVDRVYNNDYIIIHICYII
jgi:hypothetical protein